MGRSGIIAIQETGSREFIAALRTADAQLASEIAAAHKAGAEIIARETRARMSDQMVSDDRTGNLERSIKAKGNRQEINVSIGGSGIPYAGWWEFGGDTKSPLGNTYREFIKEGRSLYPAAAAKREEVEALLLAVLAHIIEVLGRG
jgi:hypothetical protein